MLQELTDQQATELEAQLKVQRDVYRACSLGGEPAAFSFASFPADDVVGIGPSEFHGTKTGIRKGLGVCAESIDCNAPTRWQLHKGSPVCSR